MHNVNYEKAKAKYEATVEELKGDILALNSQIDNPEKSKSMSYKLDLTSKVAALDVTLAKEKKEGMIDINERERAKIYAIKRLSEEMDFKVKETQANLMALNDEQL